MALNWAWKSRSKLTYRDGGLEKFLQFGSIELLENLDSACGRGCRVIFIGMFMAYAISGGKNYLRRCNL